MAELASIARQEDLCALYRQAGRCSRRNLVGEFVREHRGAAGQALVAAVAALAAAVVWWRRRRA